MRAPRRDSTPRRRSQRRASRSLRIHLDTDLGGDIDDLCALAMLLKWPGAEITGITTVDEEAGRRAGYATEALRQAGQADIPVAAGADSSSGRYRQPAGFPDEATYWPEPVPPRPGPLDAALALLRRSIAAGATVVGIGPFTNLALFDERYPGLLRTVPLVLMGGHVRPARAGFPQWDDEVDWNVKRDPVSARHVLEHLHPTLVPIEVTAETSLRRADLPALAAAGPLGRLLARQARAFAADERHEERYGRTYAGLPDDAINFQHDPLACAVALGWQGVRVEELPLRAAWRGDHLRELVDPAGRPLPVVTAVDGPRFNALWRDLVCG